MAPRIDVYDPSVYERSGIPFAQLTWLRENSPVHWHPDPEGPGFWAVTRYADVVAVSRAPEVFSSQRRSALLHELTPEGLATNQMIMLSQDPPLHTRTRSLVSRGFTPRMIARLEDRIRAICHEMVDRVIEQGSADFVGDLAAPLPLHVICELMGAPAADRDAIFTWSNQAIGADDPEYEGADGTMALFGYAMELGARHRTEPLDGIMGALLEETAEGRALTEEEFGMFVVLLAVAGNETTRNAASGGMLAFSRHPAQWRRLQADRSLLETAPDEIVRWVTPVNAFRRTATRDTEIGGHPIAENDKVIVFYAAANRDPEAFDEPDVFDIGRPPGTHVGFGGGGPHFCLGSHLARLELRVLFETLLDRTPDIALSAEPRRLRSSFVNGIKEMPVTFTPGERRG
ncbi:cytochrome P450 [Nocardiopsis sediminis]|uniref:Cytochrome P450 n=1 Tax=Nocardiopsis sediminis TaxID=1778267 RepID=A0ABV8FL28_9ACTN